MRSSATLARARGIQSRCRSYRNFSFFQRSFWLTAIHIMRSHLDTRISRPWHTRTFAKTKTAPNGRHACSSWSARRDVHTQTATTPAGSRVIPSRTHGGQLGAVSASALSNSSPQPRLPCRSLRASARKEPPNHRKFEDRSARCKRACGNKWVPKGEDGDKGSESRQ
jgi:hypothetical protein